MGESTHGRPSYLPSTVRLPDDFDGIQINLDRAWPEAEIARSTTLDTSQSHSLQLALTTRVSLIQGPPGTGKTFIGSLVARIILLNTTAKILCVCYTNHALDQFLEYILDKVPLAKVARVGGMTKSERLKPYTLSAICQKEDVIRDSKQRRSFAMAVGKAEGLASEIEATQARVRSPLTWELISEYLLDEWPELYQACYLESQDADGFELVGQGGRAKKLEADYFWQKWCDGEIFRREPAVPVVMPPVPAGNADADDAEEGKVDDDGAADAFAPFEAARNLLQPQPSPEWETSLEERVRLLGVFRAEIFAREYQELARLYESYRRCKQEIEVLKRENERSVLLASQVIGATTTGAAKYKDLLDHAAADVVMVEEAGEILEAHVLTSLSAGTKHIILIGDHKQLRPKLESHNLTIVANRGYNLDCSLFERLVLSSNLPNSLLQVQHRMRPEISQLIRMSIYPELQDHPSVQHHPHVLGISKDLLFVDHRVLEDQAIKEGGSFVERSKTNSYEASYCVEVVRLLLLQGYRPKQLVILTPYLGQLRLIQRTMQSVLSDVIAVISDLDKDDLRRAGLDDDENDDGGPATRATFGRQQAMPRFRGNNSVPAGGDPKKEDGVRVSTVDNFQGEEADVVVISLVRSNGRGDIGFLHEFQRVNVMLSRARHGMIIVGNSETLKASGKGKAMWIPLLKHMQDTGSLVTSVPSFCQQHPDDVCYLSTPAEFRTMRPNGGCALQCPMRLACGHSCPQRCHTVDKHHNFIKCFEPCARFAPNCPSNHPCRRLCFELCPPCAVPAKVNLPCGHTRTAQCCQTHTVEDIGNLECTVLMTVTVPMCGHVIDTTCTKARENVVVCTATCGALQPCGHACTRKCSVCIKEGGHQCGQKCARALFCGHDCTLQCHASTDCKPCQRPCELCCDHSKCALPCGDACPPCIAPCVWACPHQGPCALPCAAPCERLPCDERCPLYLACGHQCPSVCGEMCPPAALCQECGHPCLLAEKIDLVEDKAFSKIDLDDDPIIWLPKCGHFYTMSTMDGFLDMSLVYARDAQGRWSQALPIEVDIKPKTCPGCRAAITGIRRYGRITKAASLAIVDRKHKDHVERSIRLFEAKKNPNPVTRLRNLDALLKYVVWPPRQRIYEAAGGNGVLGLGEAPLLGGVRKSVVNQFISVSILIADECLEQLQAIFEANKGSGGTDETAQALQKICFARLHRAIELADATTSVRSAARLRIINARLLSSSCARPRRPAWRKKRTLCATG